MSKVLIGVCGVVLWASLAQAQFGPGTVVVDPSNLAQNVTQVAYTLELVTLSLRNLQPWTEGLGQAVQVASDLQQLMQQLDAIAQQMIGRRSLWGGIGAYPSTFAEFGPFRRFLDQTCVDATTQGLEAQSLLTQAPMLLNTLSQLVGHLQNVLGALAGLQAASAILGGVAGQLAAINGALTSANEPALCEKWAHLHQKRALESLQYQALRDYAVWPGE